MTLHCIMLFMLRREQRNHTTVHYIVYIEKGTD